MVITMNKYNLMTIITDGNVTSEEWDNIYDSITEIIGSKLLTMGGKEINMDQHTKIWEFVHKGSDMNV